MSGLEFAGLALAILPIVMSAIDHYKNAAEHSKDLTSDKNSINRQLDFYSDLNDELALLNGTLNGVAHGFPLRVGGVVSSPLTAHEKEEIARVLGDNAMPFQTILERLLKSLEALISDKSFKADDLMNFAHGRKSTLQIVFDQEKLWQIQSRKRSLSLEKQKDLSLKDLLHDPDHHIRLKEQRILAVTLAHAALHCSDGPWLGEDWSKEHITFFTNDPSGEPDLSRPFLKVRFEAGLKRTDDDCDLFNLHTNPALLSLGILLLEIYLKGPIESRWSPEDLDEGEPNENTNLTTAIRLLQDAEGEIYEGYRKAVRACLQSDIQDVDADELRRKVYQEIVWPLEQELDHGFHIKPEDLQLAPAGFV
ncbi:MAG: hypothetical protein M1821_004880 [Bathelium mastoideum]|nr:MAG: hypothetical protein M1821_004880 [Bathelium mastoideum]